MANDFPGTAVASGLRVLSVAELLRSVRDTLERRFPLAWVRGELSNLSRAPSGHCYFTLKDRGAQVDCVMYRSRAAAFDRELRDGMQVEAQVLVTLYEPRGRFQLTVEAMRPAGLGPLYERFLRLKENLEREGLFAPAAKREPPPAYSGSRGRRPRARFPHRRLRRRCESADPDRGGRAREPAAGRAPCP